MSLTTAKKSQCATCGKPTGIFTCCGCTKNFCTHHVIDHRQTLGKHMEEIILDHDQLRQKLNEYSADPRLHPLIEKVDEWERISIEKIRQVANDTRQKLSNAIQTTSPITDALEALRQELNKAREADDFVETDLKIWIEKLNKLKKNLIEPDRIQVLYDVNASSFISKLTIKDQSSIDIFDKSAGSIRIEDNGKVIAHTQANSHGSVRGRGEYSAGKYEFAFKLEEFQPKSWGFFGIISKDAPMLDSSWNTPHTFGWTTNWNVTHNGRQLSDAVAEMHKIAKNDIYQLLLDCDQRTIRLTHVPTNTTHQLNVNIAVCPFPWQIFLGIHTSIDDRIRIL